MKTVYQYNQREAEKQFVLLVRQWQNNAAELYKKSKSNPKVQEMCQSLGVAMESMEEWSQLNGSLQLVAIYQPGMFDDEDFDRGATFDPR